MGFLGFNKRLEIFILIKAFDLLYCNVGIFPNRASMLPSN